MVGAAGGHADDNVAVLYDARKIKIAACPIVGTIDRNAARPTGAKDRFVDRPVIHRRQYKQLR